MLRKNFINTSIYISIAHTKIILKKYFKELNNIFKLISKIEKGLTSKKK